jgi:hypothetical protein
LPTLPSTCSKRILDKLLMQPQNDPKSVLEGYGTTSVWGFSRALDLNAILLNGTPYRISKKLKIGSACEV